MHAERALIWDLLQSLWAPSVSGFLGRVVNITSWGFITDLQLSDSPDWCQRKFHVLGTQKSFGYQKKRPRDPREDPATFHMHLGDWVRLPSSSSEAALTARIAIGNAISPTAFKGSFSSVCAVHVQGGLDLASLANVVERSDVVTNGLANFLHHQTII